MDDVRIAERVDNVDCGMIRCGVEFESRDTVESCRRDGSSIMVICYPQPRPLSI